MNAVRSVETKRTLRETIEQAVTSGRYQVGLTAAARHVRRVPGLDERGDHDAIPVDVTEHGAPGGAAGPIAAGQVHVRRKRPALRRGPVKTSSCQLGGMPVPETMVPRSASEFSMLISSKFVGGP